MDKLAHGDVITLLMQVSVMLIAGRLFAEGARRLNQPAVVGEIFAGIVLGQTILGYFFPDFFESLFPAKGDAAIALDGIIHLSVILLLFIAGLEVELHIVWQQGKQAVYTSFMGLIMPFAIGFLTPWFFPDLFGIEDERGKLLFSLFLGSSLSITALPVIARILMDLEIFRSKLGMLIISSAMVNDLVSWLIFSVILSMMETNSEQMAVGFTIILTLTFTLLMLTVGKRLIDKLLPLVNKKFAWPGGLLSLAVGVCLLGAAFTEYIGIHAVFGAFIVGVALGDSVHLTEKAKEIIHQFINNIFAPLFFVSIGLHINFAANFDFFLVAIILLLAFSSKIIGSSIGAYMGGFSKKESLAVGFGMNVRGGMQIILALIALEVTLINEKIFVALVVMALVTSITAGPFMKFWLRKPADEIIPEKVGKRKLKSGEPEYPV